MKDGFYTALGTPLDDMGNFMQCSFEKQVEDQVSAGASGLLALGSMGIEPYIKDSEYLKIAKTVTYTAKNSCPVFVGVMDNSVSRVKDRIKALAGLKIDGVVATVPFYYAVTQDEVANFFMSLAKGSPFPIYMYDLPGVTKTKINIKTAEYLMMQDNINGIKTGDIITARVLLRSPKRRKDFNVFFSGLDVFDIAYHSGIGMNLDGMFACTSKIALNMYSSLRNSNNEQAGKYLDDILLLRDTLAEAGIFPAFTYAMNLLGFEGRYSPDYSIELKQEQKEKIMVCMKKCGVI